MKVETVVTSNIIRCLAAIDRLASRDANVEGLALVSGITGEGKTTAISYICNRREGIYIRARATWTPRSFLQSLVEELDLSPTYALDPMLHAAINKLRLERTPLFIDEADYLIARSSGPSQLDVLRDLYDETKLPIVLIGSTELQRRLRTNRRFDKHQRRISEWIEFAGVTRDDAVKVVEQLAEVEVEPDLISALHEASQGNMAALVAGLHRVEQLGLANSLDRVTKAHWGSRKLPKPARHGYFAHEVTS